MAKIKRLSKKTMTKIADAVDALFDKMKVRLLGPRMVDKKLFITYNREKSLPGLYEQAHIEEKGIPDKEHLDQLVRTTENYLEAVRHRAKAKTVVAVQSFMAENPDANVTDVLGGELADIYGQVKHEVRRIADTEAQHFRNVGVMDGIVRVSAAHGISDPIVYFVTVRDQYRCEECTRLHLLEDGITPRVWKLSELGHGYHQKGDENPKVGGLHPHCRCVWDGNAPVITESGIKPLKSVEIGDRVLTHTGKFKKVIGTFSKDGLLPEKTDDVYRIEFRSPLGKIHKLRVTNDHLMLTQRGWVRAEALVPGKDTLEYLFASCETCKKAFPHNIQKPRKRFCSYKCSISDKIGKPSPTLGRKATPEEKELRLKSIKALYEKKHKTTFPQKTVNCNGCGNEFTVETGYRDKSGHWVSRKNYKLEYCSRSCISKAIALKQWSSAEHRLAVSEANRKSMLEQYRTGRRNPLGIKEARQALYGLGRGGSKDEKRLYQTIKSSYLDAESNYSIGRYFADVAIPSIKTVVEWDGGGHWLDVYKGKKTMEEKIAEDATRDEFMRSLGWHVLRYTEETGFSTIFEDIRRVAQNSTGQYSFRPVEIVKVVRIPASKASPGRRLYDITVEDDSSFVVMGIVSHNCSMTTLLPGFGFDSAGMVAWKGEHHDEFERQRAGL